MDKERRRRAILDCLRRKWAVPAFFAFFSVANLAIFVLYGLEPEPFLYSEMVGLFLLAVYGVVVCWRAVGRAERRERLLASIDSEWKALFEPESMAEEDYHEMIRQLGVRAEQLADEQDAKQQDMEDYYTVWVHQIKTPIAVMRMLLAGEDSAQNRALSSELFRIEHYVEMVLQYIRLGSGSNDLVVREYDLDELIRTSIRKYAAQFIGRKLRLVYEGTDRKIVTDAKWFACILEQLLSNAVKYTMAGSVTIRVSEDGRLSIRDTGIGIAPEDLPRIFEKGYTGINGRGGQKSSGLGLYLCRKAADKLSIPIRAESVPGEGTTFTLNLNQDERV